MANKKLFVDRLLLILIAIIISIVFFGFTLMSSKYFPISDGWMIFILINSLNVIILTSICFPLLKRIEKRLIGIALFFALQICAILIAFLLFYSGSLDLPVKGILFSYGIGLVVIDFALIAIFLILIVKLGLAKRSDIDKVIQKL